MLDERFFTHRLKSTSLAAMVGALVTGGCFFYYQVARGEIRTDLLMILSAMAATKIGAMLYYRFFN